MSWVRRRERRNAVGWVGRFLSPACTVFSVAGLVVCFGLTVLWGISSRHYVQYFRGPVLLAAWSGVFEVGIEDHSIQEVDGEGPGFHWRRHAVPIAPDAPWFRFADEKSLEASTGGWSRFKAYLPCWLLIGAGGGVTLLAIWCRTARTWVTVFFRVTAYGCLTLAVLWVASIFWSMTIGGNGHPSFSVQGGCFLFSSKPSGLRGMVRFGAWSSNQNVPGPWVLSVSRGMCSWSLPALGLSIPRVIGVARTTGVSVPIWLLIGLALGPAYLIARSYGKQFGSGHCRKCGYDLTGNESGVCSECGTAIPKSESSAIDNK